MSRDPLLYIDEMVEARRRAIAYASGTTKSDMVRDTRTFDAIIRCPTVLGEAAKGIPSTIREARPTVQWKEAAGMRDKVARHYFGVDEDIVWDAVVNHLPRLPRQLEAILDPNARSIGRLRAVAAYLNATSQRTIEYWDRNARPKRPFIAYC